MDACEGIGCQTENESDGKNKNPDLPYDDRFYNKKMKFHEKNRRLPNATIQQNDVPSSTMLYNLPLEMLDVILQNCYLSCILNSPTKQIDEEVIRLLMSVDDFFKRRVTRQRFKKTIWCYLKDYYGKAKKTSAIIRNNRNYLVDNIQPSDELIDSLLSLNCIKEGQRHCIQRQRSTRNKNDELLYVLESFEEKHFSDFVKCLRKTNQQTAAKIIEDGGVVMKIMLQIPLAKCPTAMGAQLLQQNIEEDLRNRNKPSSHQTDELAEEGIEILGSQLDRQNVVVWIWCRSQAALGHIQKLYETTQLRDVLFGNLQPSISMVITTDRNQFTKAAVVRTLSIKCSQIIEIRDTEHLQGVTKLQTEIYVLCQSISSHPNVIRVFEDRHPFHLQKEIEIKFMKYPWDIGSSEYENCLYISDYLEACVWKITREKDEQHQIVKWLTTDYQPRTLSVSCDAQLLILNDSILFSSLMIYGSDAELIRSIPLPMDIITPRHAVKTSTGNFIIIHAMVKEERVREVTMDEEKLKEWFERIRKNRMGRREDMIIAVSVLTRDGEMVNRRFTCIPSDEEQELGEVDYYLTLDSDDRVFVADTDNDSVIILDSDLKWDRIICPAKEDEEKTSTRQPWRLCYADEMKQLIVGGHFEFEIDVFTLSRN